MAGQDDMIPDSASALQNDHVQDLVITSKNVILSGARKANPSNVSRNLASEKTSAISTEDLARSKPGVDSSHDQHRISQSSVSLSQKSASIQSKASNFRGPRSANFSDTHYDAETQDLQLAIAITKSQVHDLDKIEKSSVRFVVD